MLASGAVLAGCSAEPRAETPAEEATAAGAPALVLPEGAAKTGQELVAGEAVKLAAVLAEPAKYFERTIVVEATANGVCQSKGCWMTITDGEAEPIWVRWSSGCGGQYSFPKDAAGRRVLVQGSFYEKEIAPADAAHLAAESKDLIAGEIAGKTYEMNATAFVLLPASATPVDGMSGREAKTSSGAG
jgi:hypothetical protein